MALIALDIPPGARSIGTDLQSSGRWRDVNLVRWREGTLRPVGGWVERNASAFSEVVRAMHTWTDNSSDRRLAAGSYNTLYYVSGTGDVFDITPVGLTAGNESATINTGFGGGFYGSGFYGTPRTANNNITEATTWALDNFGEYLVACSNADGKLYEWQLGSNTVDRTQTLTIDFSTGTFGTRTLAGLDQAAQIANSPVDCLSLVVTEERFLFALGAGGNPRLVQWCDREDNTTWTPAATNEAGSQELQTNGSIMTGIRTKGQTLILTDSDAHSASYQGPPFVYGFERVGSSCGIASRKAVAAVDDGVFWMGVDNFYQFNGTSVSPLPCEIADHVFGDINLGQISKAWAVPNAQHGEVWFFYPSGASNEVDRYAFLDYREGHWGFGELARTAGADAGTFREPIWADPTGNTYQHETGTNYDGATIYAETGPLSMGAGDNTYSVNKLYPDEKTQGDVTATFKTRFYPNDTERSYGPFSMAAPTSVRFSGRQVRMRVEGAMLSDWRVGVMRLDAMQRGVR